MVDLDRLIVHHVVPCPHSMIFTEADVSELHAESPSWAQFDEMVDSTLDMDDLEGTTLIMDDNDLE